MNKYLKYQPAWLQLIIFASLTVVSFLIAGLIVTPVIANFYDLRLADLSPFNFENPNVVAALGAFQSALSITLFLVPSLLFSYLSDPRPLHYIGCRKPVPLFFFVIAIVVMVSALPLVVWLGELNHNVHFSKQWSGLENWIKQAEKDSNVMLRHLLVMKSPKDLFTMLIVLAVVPAFVEEFFFMGVLQRLFIQIFKRPWTGIIVSAIIFSAIHGQFLGFLPRVVLGIILGALFWYSGSLWPGILAHFVHNGLQVVVAYLNPALIEKDPNVTSLMITGSTLLILGLTWWMTRISQTSYAEVYDTDDDFTIGPRDQFTA